MFSFLRAMFAIAFFVAWAVIRPLHRATSFLFVRVAEAEKGPLTAVALLLASFVKLIELLLKLSSPPR
jgi:hypothetical protein